MSSMLTNADASECQLTYMYYVWMWTRVSKRLCLHAHKRTNAALFCKAWEMICSEMTLSCLWFYLLPRNPGGGGVITMLSHVHNIGILHNHQGFDRCQASLNQSINPINVTSRMLGTAYYYHGSKCPSPVTANRQCWLYSGPSIQASFR